jgi:hypothetical protein
MFGHFTSTEQAGMMELYITLARLPKLLLFQRLSKMMHYEAVRLSKHINPAYLHMAAQLLLIMMLTHWVGCAWVLLANVFGFGSTRFLMAKTWENALVWDKYQYAIFWGLSKMTSSDSGTGAPEKPVERIFAMFVSLAGIAAYAALISSLSNYVLSMSNEGDRVQAKIEKVHNFLRKKHMPKELADRVSSHMEYKLYHEQDQEEREIFAELPNKLRAEIILYTHKSFIAAVPFLKNCNDRVVRQLILKLKRTVFAPQEYVFHAGDRGDSMYFISKGQVEVKNAHGNTIARITQGNFFGEMDLLQNRGRVASVKTLTFCDMLELRKKDLYEVAERDEDFVKQLKEYSKVWMAPGDKEGMERLPSLVALPKRKHSFGKPHHTPAKSPKKIIDSDSDSDETHSSMSDNDDYSPLVTPIDQVSPEDYEHAQLRNEVTELTRSLSRLVDKREKTPVEASSQEPDVVSDTQDVEPLDTSQPTVDGTDAAHVSNWKSPSIVALKFLIKLGAAAKHKKHDEKPMEELPVSPISAIAHRKGKLVKRYVKSPTSKRTPVDELSSPKSVEELQYIPPSQDETPKKKKSYLRTNTPVKRVTDQDIDTSLDTSLATLDTSLVETNSNKIVTKIGRKSVKRYVRSTKSQDTSPDDSPRSDSIPSLSDIERHILQPNTVTTPATAGKKKRYMRAKKAQEKVLMSELPQLVQQQEKVTVEHSDELQGLDRHIIEQAILYADTSKLEHTPESVIVLHKALKQWTPEQYPSFATNIINSINLVAKIATTIDDIRTIMYWFRCSYLLAALSNDDIPISRIIRDFRFTPVTENNERQYDIDDVFVNSLDMFATELARICCRTYQRILESSMTKIEPIVMDAVFKRETLNMTELFTTLDLYVQLLKSHSSCVSRHFLTSIATWIDACIFNRMIFGAMVNATRVKEAVSSIECWFDKRGFEKNEILKYSRQCTNALTIGREQFQHDEEMHGLVCPDLSVEQVRHLLDIGMPGYVDQDMLMMNPIINLSGAIGPLFELEQVRVDRKYRVSEKYKKEGLEFLTY